MILNVPSTVGSAIELTYRELAGLTDAPGSDGRLLLAETLNRSREWLISHPEAPISTVQGRAFLAALKRYQSGEPLPYVLGWWEFYGRRFSLSPAVLIPRPETEILIEEALTYLQAHPRRRRVIDVGTGSGCIGVTLAAEIGDLIMVATDISRAALKIALMNACLHGVEAGIHPVQSDLTTAITGSFDLVCANLPYIPSETLRGLPVGGKEPWLALDGGPDGLRFVHRLLRSLPGLVSPGGRALIEIEANQGQVANEIAHSALPAAQISVKKDLAGHNRLIVIDRI